MTRLHISGRVHRSVVPLRFGALFTLCIGALGAQSPSVVLNPTAALFGARIVQSGDTAHACGQTGVLNQAGFIHYARSVDGGRTWPQREVPLAFTHSVSDLAVSGDVVVVLVGSQYLGPHTITSFDGGATFRLPVRVSSQNAQVISPIGRLFLDGLNVNVVWLENRASGGSIWTNRSTDGGMTWSPTETRLDVGIVAPSAGAGASNLELIGDGALLHALWQETSATAPLILHQRSTDGGATWLPQPNVVATSILWSAGGAGNLLFAARGSPLPDLRSTNGGASWSPVSGAGFVAFDDVAVAGQDVLAVSAPGFVSTQLMINVSRDGGTTWLPAPFILPSPLAIDATAAIVGDTLLVHGRYPNNTPPGGFVIQSDDYGVNWRLMTNLAAVGLWPSRDRLIVTTVPVPSGANLIAYVLAGHTTLGSATAGTGGLAPRLEGNGLPTLGRTFALDVRDARQNALGMFAASFAPAVAAPLGSATLWVQPPTLAVFFATSSAGEAMLPVTVPTSTAFAGLVLTSQAFVLDPIAAGGFSSTSARQSWLR